jgi:2-haloalkanoic acid dehalogenase type II
MPAQRPVVTFDLFSALIDSRAGGAAALDDLGGSRGWPVSGEDVYDAWDARNKEAQRTCARWVPYRELARRALADTYTDLGLPGEPGEGAAVLLGSMPDWPLWPDVDDGLPRIARSYRVGLLSNVDDDLFLSTRAAVYVDPALAMTSQRLGVYKPDAAIYHRAREALGEMVHVATSARDVRGALEAGIPVVRLRRHGHALDPDGPRPDFETERMADLEDLVATAWGHAG